MIPFKHHYKRIWPSGKGVKNIALWAGFFTQMEFWFSLGREFQKRIKVREPLVSRALKVPKIKLIGEDSLANHNSIYYNL
jgi:hypothetical protein